MILWGEILFWTGVAWLAYVYAGYPLALWIVGRWRAFRPELHADCVPSVSVLVSARNEAKDIGWKVEETLGWNYPAEKLEMLVASDASEDATDEILRSISDSRLKHFRIEPRAGKNEALNFLASCASGELLFFSDANSHIDGDCLRRMVRFFSDARVGCVTGSEHTIRGNEEMATAGGTRAFLSYESILNTLESHAGSVLACDGSIFAMRRSLFRTLHPELANDLELPMHAGAEGYAILFDPEALAFEKATSKPGEEFRRKRRICGQGALAFWRMRNLLRGLRAWQFASRKILRWLGVIPLALVLAGSILLAPGDAFYTAALTLQIVFYAFALLGWWLSATSRPSFRAANLPFYFLLVNLAAFLGVVNAIAGKRFAVWESPAHSRGAGPGGSSKLEMQAVSFSNTAERAQRRDV